MEWIKILTIEDLFYNNGAENNLGSVNPVKPSKDGKDRISVNGRLRRPSYKQDSCSEAPLILGNGIQYGEHITYIDINRAKEHRTPKRQIEKLNTLLGLLKISPGDRNMAYLRELYKDLERYPTSILPKRSAHDGLMAAVKTSIEYGTPVDISIVKLHMSEGKLAVGYEVNPIS